jgi:hypothetical protein
MADLAPNAEREFWKPPVLGAGAKRLAVGDAVCWCGCEFVPGAQFCHVCGAARAELSPPSSWLSYFELHRLQKGLGLPTASLVFFFLGVACCLAALLVNIFFSAQTVLDWEAVHTWRIEWLLAAAVAFLAGVLLKRPV